MVGCADKGRQQPPAPEPASSVDAATKTNPTAPVGWRAQFRMEGKKPSSRISGRIRALGDRLRIEVDGDPITTIVDLSKGQVWDFDSTKPTIKLAVLKAGEPLLKESFACATTPDRCLWRAAFEEKGADEVDGHSCKIYEKKGVELFRRTVDAKVWRPVDLAGVPFIETQVGWITTILLDVTVGPQEAKDFQLPDGFATKGFKELAPAAASDEESPEKDLVNADLKSGMKRVI